MKDLSSHIMDLLRNSIRAQAERIEIDVIEDTDKDIYRLIFRDNGSGIDEAILIRIVDPFYLTRKPDRKTGFGLPLLKQSAEKTDGGLMIDSIVGKGTTV
jgi:signal transduction histidine kinase